MKRLREEIEMEVSVKTDDPDQLAEYTKMVLGDNAEFFDCDFDDCKPCKDEITPIEVLDDEEEIEEKESDEEDDDMSDEEFIEAFGKAMKEKHDEEVLNEGEFSKKVKNFVNNKVVNPIKKAAGSLFTIKDGTKSYVVKSFVVKKEKDADGKETGKIIRVPTGSVMKYNTYKGADADAKARSLKKDSDGNSIWSSISVMELDDKFKDVCDKHDYKIDPADKNTWKEFAIYTNGDIDPRYKDIYKGIEGKVNDCIKLAKEEKSLKKATVNGEEINPETGNPVAAEQAAQEVPPVVDNTSEPAKPETSAITADSTTQTTDTSADQPVADQPAQTNTSTTSTGLEAARTANKLTADMKKALAGAGMNVAGLTGTKAANLRKTLKKLFAESLEDKEEDEE